MKLIFKFFDEEKWSIHATLQTIIIIFILKLGGIKKVDLNFLVLSSLIAMMPEGELISRIIFTYFLSILTWSNSKYFLRNTILTVIATIITGLIPYNNLFHKLAMSNNIIKYSLWLSVFIWMLIVLLLVLNKYNIYSIPISVKKIINRIGIRD